MLILILVYIIRRWRKARRTDQTFEFLGISYHAKYKIENTSLSPDPLILPESPFQPRPDPDPPRRKGSPYERIEEVTGLDDRGSFHNSTLVNHTSQRSRSFPAPFILQPSYNRSRKQGIRSMTDPGLRSPLMDNQSADFTLRNWPLSPRREIHRVSIPARPTPPPPYRSPDLLSQMLLEQEVLVHSSPSVLEFEFLTPRALTAWNYES